MQFELKDFQVTAADMLMDKLVTARFGVSRKQPQAVVLSSPTGSGKTVIITEMIERVLRGHNGTAGDQKAVFLWLSDSPELNTQSRNKIEEATDLIPPDRLVTIEHPFNYERLAPGRVYFLNTQKLTASSLLTKEGNFQNWTIWQIIENTAKAAPQSFYLIIDEAHRGMREVKTAAARTRAENARLTTVQRFVKGDTSIGLSPVPLIVGISATPERFYAVLKDTDRTPHAVTVEPDKVRGSGLIKDRIKLAVAEKGDQADWSMLAEAGRKWVRFTKEWQDYCAANELNPVVRPALVVQVENGTNEIPTKTNLATCIKVLQDVCGHLPPASFAHAFTDEGDVPAGGITLRKIDASKIQDDPLVRVVFFKTALSTGWDCPRAEVMMSFRKAIDDTLIAQLVGRMVRTPLARRVEGNDVLNSVNLALPHYDEAAVNAIIKKLQDPESGATGEVVRDAEMVTYRRVSGKDELFQKLATVQTYAVDRPRRIAETSRLMKLARRLSMDGVSQGLIGKAKQFVIDRIFEQRDRLRKDPQWAARVKGQAQIPVKEFTIEYGEWKLGADPESYLIPATDENIYALFDRCGSVLGEGLHETYANRGEFRRNVNGARLELFCILQDEKALKVIQQACEREFDRLWEEFKGEVADMHPPHQERYKELRRRGSKVSSEPLTPIQAIELKKEGTNWHDHLFLSDAGEFWWKAGSWEALTLEAERKRSGYVGFIRNASRREGSLCIPYGADNDKAMYPDLLVFRKTKTKVEIDILEPHGDQFADHLPKAQGLARYAMQHGDTFGRIEMIRLVKGKLERLDMKDDKVRSKVLKATAEQLGELYEKFG
jgi:type III restriction enzyme